MREVYIVMDKKIDKSKIQFFKVQSGQKNEDELNPETRLYYNALYSLVMKEVSNYKNGIIDHDRLYDALEILDNTMQMTNDELAISMLRELYDRSVKMAGLE